MWQQLENAYLLLLKEEKAWSHFLSYLNFYWFFCPHLCPADRRLKSQTDPLFQTILKLKFFTMSDQKNNKIINIALWVAQVLVGLMFLMAGVMKVSQPVEALAESLPWVTSVSEGLVRFIGASEFLGGLGLVLPSLLRIKPFLTVWAAIGLGLVMLFAAIFHASRGEFPAIGMNVMMMALVAFVAWGRSKKAPILAK